MQGLGLLSCGAEGDFSALSSGSLSRCSTFLSSCMSPGETSQQRCGAHPGGPGSGWNGCSVGEAHPGFTNDRRLSDGVSRCLWAQKVDLGVRFAPFLFSYLPRQTEGQSRLLGTLPTCWDTSVASPGAGRAQPVALGSRFRPSSPLRSAEFIHPPLHPGRSGRRGLSFLSGEQVEWSCRVVW